MLKYFLVITLVTSCLILSAQNLSIGFGLHSTKTAYKTFADANLEKSNSQSNFDINLMLELNSNKFVSINAGLFFHSFELGYGHWVSFGTGKQYNTISYEASFIDLPIMITFNVLNKNKVSIIQFSAGPFISHGFGGSTVSVIGKASGWDGFPTDFKKNNPGLMLSIGVNIKKWQLRGYFRKEFNSLLKEDSYSIKEINNSVTGFNIVRVINLSKQSSETKK